MNKTWTKVLFFVIITVCIWGGYFWWRPPQLILGVSQSEHLNPASKQIALTFDDAPHPLTTPLLLAALRRVDAKATFFAVGQNIRMYPQLARDIVQGGSKLGNHSQHHHNLTTLSDVRKKQEIMQCFEQIQNYGPKTRLFRPPGGGVDWQTLRLLLQQHLTLAWWSNNVGDWQPMPAWKIVYHVRHTLRSGDIVLMHDAGTSTPNAVPTIVREARERGLKIVTMPG